MDTLQLDSRQIQRTNRTFSIDELKLPKGMVSSSLYVAISIPITFRVLGSVMINFICQLDEITDAQLFG